MTPVIDRDYFWAIYFRTPGGVLFEVATNEPGFDRDEDTAHLGEALKPAAGSTRTCGSELEEPSGAAADDHGFGSESYAYHARGPGRGQAARLRLPWHRRHRDPVRAAGTRASARGGDRRSARATCPNRVRLRFFRRRGEGDYDMEDLARRTRAMGDFVEAHVAAGKPSRVLGLGYSNGANILASVLFSRPGLFEGAVLMHPLIPWTPEPTPMTTRVLVTSGDRDPIAPAAGTRALEDWFRSQGAEVTVLRHPGGHEIDRSEIAAIARFLR